MKFVKFEDDLSEVLVACGRAAKEAETAIGRGIIVALHRSAQESLPLYLIGSGLPSIKGLIGKGVVRVEG